MNYRQFRNRFRLIPIGKFALSGRGKPPFNQIFVGRSKERASFIELITHQEKFGAFMVSGRRGSGKTSFVDYILSEYIENSFQRFIRFARSKAGVRDLAVGVTLATISAIIIVIMGQAIALFSQNAFVSFYSDNTNAFSLKWAWFILAALLLLSTLLWSLAWRSLHAAMQMNAKGSDQAIALVFYSISIALIIYHIYFSNEFIVIKSFLLWLYENTWLIGFIETSAICFSLFYLGLSLKKSNVGKAGFKLAISLPLIYYFTALIYIYWDDLSLSAANFFREFADIIPYSSGISGVMGGMDFCIISIISVSIIYSILRNIPSKTIRIKSIRWILTIAVFVFYTFCIQMYSVSTKDTANAISTKTDLIYIAANNIKTESNIFKSETDKIKSEVININSTAQSTNNIKQSIETTDLKINDSIKTINTAVQSINSKIKSNKINDEKIKTAVQSIKDTIQSIKMNTYPWLRILILFIIAMLLLLIDYNSYRSKYYFKSHHSKPDHERSRYILFSLIPLSIFLIVLNSSYHWISSQSNPLPSFFNNWLILLLLPLAILSLIPIIRLIFYKFKSPSKLERNTQSTTAHELGGYYARSPVNEILFIKSCFLILLAFALLAPVLNIFGAFPSFLYPLNDPAYPKATQYNYPDVQMFGYTIFGILVTILTIFFYEYEWISRALRIERQEASIAPLGASSKNAKLEEFWPKLDEKPKEREHDPNWFDFRDGNPLRIPRNGVVPRWMRRQEITREIEKATFAYIFYESRVPVLSTWINLGFDNLKHDQIIEAMLVQLREQYRAKFISINSKIGLIAKIIAILLTLLISKQLANTFFHVGKISDPNLIYSVNTTKSYKNDSTIISGEKEQSFFPLDYCALFSKHPEYAPAVNHSICLLPYSNQFYSFFYSPLLTLDIDFFGLSSDKNDGLIISSDFPELNFEPHSGMKCTTSQNSSNNNVCFPYVYNNQVMKFLFDSNFGLPLIKTSKNKENYVLYHPEPADKKDAASQYINQHGLPTLRVYHIFLFMLAVLIIRTVNNILKILPYRSREKEMTRLIALIRGHITYTVSDMPKVGWLQWLLGIRRRDETIETKPDPRVVEQSFIDLLQNTTKTSSEQHGFVWSWFEARPEIVFVFDEMDKLSGKADPEISRTDEVKTITEENTKERQRSQQLHQLLSDMKRLLSSDSARFIFIGGRLYHDEWLADQAISTPLLSSIFTGQLYLPSLLTDREDSFGRFNDRIAEFIVLMFRNSKHRYEYWKRLRLSPAFTGSSQMSEPTYIQAALPHLGHSRRLAAMAHYVQMRVLDEGGGSYSYAPEAKPPFDDQREYANKLLTSGEQETLEQLLNFLTYRSAGNPKKLKEILQSLVLPTSKALDLPRHDKTTQHKVRWQKLAEDHDSILLDDNILYRMQFIDVLYRHLAEHLESRMLSRDDKVAMSIFYLMDFLLKFHNRAFSWTNLQRVDELSHIHRAPDLKSMMGVLVDVSSERFLHRVFNGVYSFRFRSDFSREIDYLSRISKEEMAAFNFTLDESQNLKGLYQKTLKTGDQENIDTISGLGELYEYDQEYEIARNYFRRALTILDKTYQETTGKNFILKDDSIEAEWFPFGVVQRDDEKENTKQIVKSNFTWAITRLRLLLQIGHTYEQEKNYERALSTYMHADKFSLAIFKAAQNNDNVYSSLTVENYSILYQASLAIAWIFEKNRQDIDDSINHAEQFIAWMYDKNSVLLSKEWEELCMDTSQSKQNKSSIMLLASDVHDQVGDLYFYKGKQSVRNTQDNKFTEENEKLRFGYLLQAHYHYAFSIWNIRNYLSLRTNMSATRLNLFNKSKQTIHEDGLFPDLIHNSLANALTDMSEAILARISFKKLLVEFKNAGSLDTTTYSSLDSFKNNYINFRKNLGKSIKEFNQSLPQTGLLQKKDADQLSSFQLYSYKEKKKPVRCKLFSKSVEAEGALVWLGSVKEWPKIYNNTENSNTKNSYSAKRTLKFEKSVDSEKRLKAYFYFSTAAAKNYAVAGYSIDAANEYFLQAETAISTLWAIKQSKWFDARLQNATPKKTLFSSLFSEKRIKQSVSNIDFSRAQCELGTIALVALKKAANLIQGSYRPSATRTGQNHGDPAKIRAHLQERLKKSEQSLEKLKKKLEQQKQHQVIVQTKIKKIEALIEKLTDQLKSLNKNSDLGDDYNMSQPWRDEPRIHALGAQLVLSLIGEGKSPDLLAELVYKDYLHKYSNELFSIPDTKDSNRDDEMKAYAQNTFNGYHKLCERFRYPILNRLKSLSFLCEAAIIHGEGLLSIEHPTGANDQEKATKAQNIHSTLVGSLCSELIVTADVYSAESHFSPHLIGTTLSMAYFYCIWKDYWVLYDNNTSEELNNLKVNDHQNNHTKWARSEMPNLSSALMTRESLGENALNQLRRSEQMFSMGKAYYENISEMQFLNDEFNDRNVHYNQAKRMFSAELIHAIASCVHDDLHSGSSL